MSMGNKLRKLYADRNYDPRPRTTNEGDRVVTAVVKLSCGRTIYTFSAVALADKRWCVKCETHCDVVEIISGDARSPTLHLTEESASIGDDPMGDIPLF